jgi:hypothetical protein
MILHLALLGLGLPLALAAVAVVLFCGADVIEHHLDAADLAAADTVDGDVSDAFQPVVLGYGTEDLSD